MVTRSDKQIIDLEVRSRNAERRLMAMDKSLRAVAKSTDRTSRSLKGFGNLVAGIGFGRATKELISSTLALEALDTQLKGVTKTTASFDRAFSFLQTTAEKFGFDMKVLEKAYVGFFANAQSAGLSVGAGEDIFEALTISARAFNLTAAELESVLLGANQTINSTSVSLEDLRQMSDRLHGGWRIAMDAIGEMPAAAGASDDAIKKLISAGKIATKDFLPLFAKGLKDANTQLASNNASGYAASVAKLTNALDDLKRSLADEGLPEALTWFVNKLTEAANLYGSLFNGKGFDAALAEMGNITESIIPGMHELNQELLTIGENKKRLEEGTVWSLFTTDAERQRMLDDLEIQREFVQARKDELVLSMQGRGSAGPAAAVSGGPGGTFKPLLTDAEKAAQAAKSDKLAAEIETIRQGVRGLTGDLDDQVSIQNKLEDQLNLLSDGYRTGVIPSYEAYEELQRKVIANSELEAIALEETAEKAAEAARDRALAMDETFQMILKRIKTLDRMADEIADSVTDAFADIVVGSQSVKEAMASMLQSIARSIAKASFEPFGDAIAGGIKGVMKNVISASIGGGVAVNALGNVYGATGLAHGVYNQPTAFPINGGGKFANGVGVMGEAGAEAILPLTRRGGKLGVEGGAMNVTVNNNAPGIDINTRRSEDGGLTIDVVRRMVADDVARGGSDISRSLEGTYGMSRGKGRR